MHESTIFDNHVVLEVLLTHCIYAGAILPLRSVSRLLRREANRHLLRHIVTHPQSIKLNVDLDGRVYPFVAQKVTVAGDDLAVRFAFDFQHVLVAMEAHQHFFIDRRVAMASAETLLKSAAGPNKMRSVAAYLATIIPPGCGASKFLPWLVHGSARPVVQARGDIDLSYGESDFCHGGLFVDVLCHFDVLRQRLHQVVAWAGL
jgi:hypothetical protein